MTVIVIPSDLKVLSRDNAVSHGFIPPGADDVVVQALYFFNSARKSLGQGAEVVIQSASADHPEIQQVTAPAGAYYQAPTSGYTADPNFVDPARATGSPITLIPKNFII